MFNELPKLLGKNFIVGYMLPAILFVLALYSGLNYFDLLSTSGFESIIPTEDTEDIKLTTGIVLLIFLSWILGIVLVSLNILIYKFFEGYGFFNPMRLLSFLERSRFTRLKQSIHNLEAEWESLGDNFSPIKIQELTILNRKFANTFPDDAEWLLPTQLGNRIRAFEVYPRVLYGFESIVGWVRLLAVVPQEYKEEIGSVKAQSDACLNTCLLSVIYLIFHVFVTIFLTRDFIYEWPILFVAIIIAIFSYQIALNRVVEWGEFVKSAFDVFLPELQKKMGFHISAKNSSEKELWSAYSRAIIFRDPDEMPTRHNPYDGNKQRKWFNRIDL